MPNSLLTRTIHTAFWNLHCVTWDSGESPAGIAERAGEIVARVEGHTEPGTEGLDVGCATGTHALALAVVGFHVTGIDIARGTLRRARVTAGQLAPASVRGSVRFVRGNLEAVGAPAPGYSLLSRWFAPVKRWASRSPAVRRFDRQSLHAELRAVGLEVVEDSGRRGWLRVTARAACQALDAVERRPLDGRIGSR